MLLNYIYAESAVKPAEIEINKDTVYIKKDITSEERTDSTGASSIWWTYQVATLTLDEFNNYVKIVNATNANGISQLMAKQETGDNNQMIIMEAIADLYDAIANLKQEGLS